MAYDREELNDNDMKEVVEAIRPVHYEFSRFLSKDRLKEGMKHFFKTYEPELLDLINSLNLDVSKVMDRLRLLLKEDVYLWHENGVKEKLPEIVKEIDLIEALNKLFETNKEDLNSLREYFRTSWFKSKLPLLCFKAGQSTEVASIIDYLYSIFYTQDATLKRDLNEVIRIKRGYLASLLRNGEELLGILVEQFTGQELSKLEAQKLYTALPDISNEPLDKVRFTIEATLSNLSRQKKIMILKQRWQELTLSESPERWSEDHRIPIHWVLETEGYYTFLSNLRKYKVYRNKKLTTCLTSWKNADELKVLMINKYILDKFIEVAAGDYEDIVHKTGQAEKLQEYIYQVFNVNVYQWPIRLNEINRLVREWVADNYKDTIYPQIQEVIDSISPDDIKDLSSIW